MAKQSQPMRTKQTPLGGIFPLAGFIIGYVYAITILGSFWPSAIVGIICFGIGFLIEPIVYRIAMIALYVIAIIARQALFSALFDSALLLEQPKEPAPYVQYKEKNYA